MLDQFLSFLADDMINNPHHIRALDTALLDRARSLISEIEIDLNAPLSGDDDLV